MTRVSFFSSILVALLAAACSFAPEKPAPKPKPAFARIAEGGDNPADNGPDDSMVIDNGDGERLGVPFAHFKHASNAKDGFGVPCIICHHTTKTSEMPSEGCISCHGAPADKDPALAGPDDNLLLGLGKSNRMPAAAFDHFTHASSGGHKLSCDRCHHTGDMVTCDSCHETIAKKTNDGKVVPKLKRAFHRQCQQCHNALAAANDAAKAPTSCKGCHTGEILARRTGNLPRSRAFHQSCVTCHEKDHMARPASRAPLACDGCHRKAPELGAAPAATAAPAQTDTASAVAQADTATASARQEATAATGKAAPPDKMLIEYAQKDQPGTPFDHKTHAELGEPCTRCHHTGMDQPRCRDCHATPTEAKRVFHKSCITCHKENGIAAGCAGCHKKS